MYIHEAVAEAVRIGGYLVHPEFETLLIKPTDSSDRCILRAKGKAPCPRWQTGARDLMSDRWTVTKEGWEE